MRKCYVLRGIPGSGKTTWTTKKSKECLVAGIPCVVCSNDQWHARMRDLRTAEGREYVKTEEDRQDARDRCLERFLTAIEDCWDDHVLVVDNTNVHVWEIVPYERLARLYDFEVEVVQTVCRLSTCYARRPEMDPAKLLRMANEMHMDRLPDHWNVVKVFTEEMPIDKVPLVSGSLVVERDFVLPLEALES